MKIVQAAPKDLVEVLFLMKVCVGYMNEKGQKHWNNAFPSADFLNTAIENKSLYLYKDKEVSKGMVILTEEEPSEYKEIKWQGSNDKVLFLQFLAVHPKWQDNNIADRLIEYAEGYAKDHKYTTIRLDIHSSIHGGEKLCKDEGFDQAGQFHTSFQQAPYLAYEKSL